MAGIAREFVIRFFQIRTSVCVCRSVTVWQVSIPSKTSFICIILYSIRFSFLYEDEIDWEWIIVYACVKCTFCNRYIRGGGESRLKGSSMLCKLSRLKKKKKEARLNFSFNSWYDCVKVENRCTFSTFRDVECFGHLRWHPVRTNRYRVLCGIIIIVLYLHNIFIIFKKTRAAEGLRGDD